MKAVFTTKIGSGYDDVVEEQYHFPSTYLAQVSSAVGDLIVYYEPRRTGDAATGGRQAYFAVARVLSVLPDPRVPDHYYARLTDYLDLDRVVPFKMSDNFFESALERDGGEVNKGAFGRSVRNIPDQEFDAILAAGFLPTTLTPETSDEISNQIDEPLQPFKRPFVEIAGTRLFRDLAFAVHVQAAYDRTCAVSGLQIINGGGRPEAQAAHIQPVAREGSDSVRNGLALSGTLHWMFDRGLISVGDDYRILVAPGVPYPVQRLINPDRQLRLPAEKSAWPHPHYLRYHRETIFKG